MPEPKRPLKVFLCHAHANRDPVRGLYSHLTNDGVDAWLDKEKLLPGQDWELEIKKAVREADVVVVCLSKQFNQAGFRQKEVRLALDTAMEQPEGEIFIIPARLEECDNLESLRKWHWVDLFEEDGYQMLMRALRRRADNIGATLQIKRSWLPKITSPLPKKQKPIENKTTETSDKKIVNNVDDMSPLPELPDDWEAQWQAAFVKNAKEEKETTDTKVDRLSEKKIRRPNTTIIVGFIVLVMASVFGLPSLFDTSMDDVPTATQTKRTVALETQTPRPSSTPSIPTRTKAPSFTATPTPLPTEITDTKGVSMVLVPAGEFTMGNNADIAAAECEKNNYATVCLQSQFEHEDPFHSIYLNAFYIDKYEVTNASYETCEKAGVCSPPRFFSSLTRSSYYSNPEFNKYPVVYIDWFQAKLFCEWREARLPTEAEWEKAARGIDGRTFPWGEGIDCYKANYFGENLRQCHVDKGNTVAVDDYKSDKSPYGVYNMAGNVSEWISDWYSETYYQNSLSTNPLGPDSGEYRVFRGGNFNSIELVLRTTNRSWINPNTAGAGIGIRCVRSVP